jgi:hypothetical protein
LKVALSALTAMLVVAAVFAALRLASPGESEAQIGIGLRSPTPVRTPTARPGAPAPTPTPAPPPPTPTGAAVGPGIFVSECRSADPYSVRVIFLWTPSRQGAQFLDLSIFNNGFAPGTFIATGALGQQQYGFVWDGLLQGTTHFARVNTLTPSGWQTSSTLAFYTPVCNPFLAEPAAGDDMIAMRDDMAAAIAGTTIDTAVAITDLRAGETVDVNGTDVRLPGCTINLFALIRVAEDLQFGRYPEPEPGDLIGQTINRSDPITARRLMIDWIGAGDETAGVTRVNDFIHALGMTDTLMDHPPAFPEETLFDGGSNRITARDANKGLKALWDGRVLNPFWRDYMLQKMTLVKPGLNYRIAAGAGAGATVSHKNGFLYEEGWADNDVGIVWFDRGGERYGYAISFFTENVPGKYDDIPLGQEIASRAYQWFVSRYGYPY